MVRRGDGVAMKRHALREDWGARFPLLSVRMSAGGLVGSGVGGCFGGDEDGNGKAPVRPGKVPPAGTSTTVVVVTEESAEYSTFRSKDPFIAQGQTGGGTPATTQPECRDLDHEAFAAFGYHSHDDRPSHYHSAHPDDDYHPERRGRRYEHDKRAHIDDQYHSAARAHSEGAWRGSGRWRGSCYPTSGQQCV